MPIIKPAELTAAIQDSVGRVIVGKRDITKLLLISVLCGGHVLLDDFPGTGKTTLAKTLAQSMNVSFKRIQFTPDLLPSDLTGINYYNQKQGEFVFRHGPVFANIVLADEINRATPRTQSSLLECMEEKQVTVDGDTRRLDEPFLVIATQNPVETSGTFPLPEAQMDRFFMRLRMGYPQNAESVQILTRFQQDNPLESVTPVASGADMLEAGRQCKAVAVSEPVKQYIADVVDRTRSHDRVALGVSPRGLLALMRAAQAVAAVEGRAFATPDHVKSIAKPVLAHRLVLKGQALSAVDKAEGIIQEILDSVKVPTEEL